MNEKLKTLQWEENSSTGTLYDHSNRCLNKRLGAYCKGVSTGGKWSKEEKHFYINVLELLALKFAILTFTKNLSHLIKDVQVDNKVTLAYLLKVGGIRSPQLLKISKSIWNYLLSHQVTITAESLSENNQILRNPNNRSICLQAVSPTSSIHGMEARSKQFCNRCNAAGLEQNVWFCIPTLQLDRSGDEQGSPGKCRSNDTSDTHMADTTLVYSPTKNVHTTSIAFTSPPKPITKSPGRKTSSCENQVPNVSGVENYRKTLEIEGISSSAAILLSMYRFSCRLRISLEQVG